MSDLRRMSQLASTYFHQDFDYEAPTPDGVVQVFVDEVGPQRAGELLDEVDELLASELGDDDLAELWHGFGGAFDPRDAETTFRDWLAHLRDLLGASIAEA